MGNLSWIICYRVSARSCVWWGLTVLPLKTGRTTNSAWNTLAEWSSPGELLLKPLPSIFLLDIALLLAAMREEDLFSRCVLCNGDSYCHIDQETLLAMQEGKVSCEAKSSSKGIEKNLSSGVNEVKLQVERVPREAVIANDKFWACSKCGKVYWQGRTGEIGGPQGGRDPCGRA